MSAISEAYKIINDFKNSVIFNNRYIQNHELLNIIRRISVKHAVYIDKESKNNVIFRARVFTDNDDYIKVMRRDINDWDLSLKYDSIWDNQKRIEDAERLLKNKKKSQFLGYNRMDSFVPPKEKTIEQRCSPKYVVYLYAASDEKTAILETKPFRGQYISIATIKCMEQLRLFDFTMLGMTNFSNIEDMVMLWLYNEFMKPNNGDYKEYIPLQYICEYIKGVSEQIYKDEKYNIIDKFDGIQFQSSLSDNGINYVLFNYENCKVSRSKIVQHMNLDIIYKEIR